MENIILEVKNKILTADSTPSAARRTADRTLEQRRTAYEDEVRRLVEACFTLVRETGSLEPRVSELVGEAGLSNQAFYRHFRSKHELLVAALDEGIRRLAAYLEHRMDAAGSPTEKVAEWIRGILEQALQSDAAAATRPFASARGRLAEGFPEEVRDSERRLTALVRDALETAVSTGELPAADPARDSEALYHLAMGWLERRLSEGEAVDRADAERLVEFALFGVRRGGARPQRTEA